MVSSSSSRSKSEEDKQPAILTAKAALIKSDGSLGLEDNAEAQVQAYGPLSAFQRKK